MNNSEKYNDQIQNELQRISKILVVIATEGKNQREKIEILSKVGFQPKEIAELLSTTSNTVSVTLAEIRKKKKNK